METIPIENLGDTIDQLIGSIENLETALHDAGVGTDFEQKDIGVNTDDLILQQEFRDLKRANKFSDSVSGQRKIVANKISVSDEKIKQLTEERDRLAFLSEDIEDERITEINEELKELRKERDLQTIHLNRDLLTGIKSQFARIRETFNTMLYFDRTLGEKIQTLFRKQGITIVSIITAIGFAIFTIATSISLGIKAATPNPKPKPDPKPKPKPDPKPGPKPGPTPQPELTPGSKEWIKKC